MDFSEFVQRLSPVIRTGSNTSIFTKTILDAVLNEAGQEILNDKYNQSTFKSYYNGNTNISGLAKTINAYANPSLFKSYLSSFPKSAKEQLCNNFRDVIPDIELKTAGMQLGNLLYSIILDAAGNMGVEQKERNPLENMDKLAILTDDASFAPDITEFKDGILYLDNGRSGADSSDPFFEYLKKAIPHFSMKKTLLYAEKPRQFYDIYVCNDLQYHKFRMNGDRDTHPETIISDATVERLEAESNFIIIEGTGGIGKTMFLNHLFLSSAEQYKETGKLPVFISLKDYKESTLNILAFVWESIAVFNPKASQRDVIELLENKSVVLLMDGLDEIQSSLREAFESDLEAFVKSYQGNTILITSRPINTFISYARFYVFDIKPLTKEQSIALIEKLDYWDNESKTNFIDALDRHLYNSHTQFASNPLLLTIMLMTYSTFGEVPAKMHVFYSKAYETMARLHDASKGSFKRPLHTNLTPEEFAKVFSEFCARTYTEEILEFNEASFSTYITKALKKYDNISARDFLLDLTDNLCIMYREGNTYFFIHRSFQEYFAAVYFASAYDDTLNKVGKFFEERRSRSYYDRTFDMLYDMIPEKVERYIFLPFLQELIETCEKSDENEAYWIFLEEQYPVIYYEEGDTGESFFNEPQSFTYQKIVEEKFLGGEENIGDLRWPEQIYDLPQRTWVSAYRNFTDSDAFLSYPDPKCIDPTDLEDTLLIPSDELPYQYESYFGEPDEVGITIEIEIYELRKNAHKYKELRDFMSLPSFPLLEEYRNVLRYYNELSLLVQQNSASENLFDD